MAGTAATASGILGLAEITLQVGSKVYKTIVGLKKAPGDILGLADELARVNDVLQNCRDYLKAHKRSRQPGDTTAEHPLVAQAVKDCYKQYLELVSIVEGFARALNESAWKRTSAKLKWLARDKEISGLVQKLERLRATFDTALLLAGWSVTCRYLSYWLRLTSRSVGRMDI